MGSEFLFHHSSILRHLIFVINYSNNYYMYIYDEEMKKNLSLSQMWILPYGLWLWHMAACMSYIDFKFSNMFLYIEIVVGYKGDRFCSGNNNQLFYVDGISSFIIIFHHGKDVKNLGIFPYLIFIHYFANINESYHL